MATEQSYPTDAYFNEISLKLKRSKKESIRVNFKRNDRVPHRGGASWGRAC